MDVAERVAVGRSVGRHSRARMDRLAPPARRAHVLACGRVAYEWEQTLDAVSVYVRAPPGARGRDLDVPLEPTRARVGVKGNAPYMEHELWARVKASESTWTLADGELALTLVKATRGEAWRSPFAAHGDASDAKEDERDKQRLMLERFQAENPGFDFSDASFNGQTVPDASTFMGGCGGG